MAIEKQFIDVFDSTFELVFAYIRRRVSDDQLAEKLVNEVYQRFFDIPFLDPGKELLTLYNLAFVLLKERNAIVFGTENFWAELSLLESEVLRLRYFENLNSVEVGFVVGESSGKVDALLYATLVKAQRLIKGKDVNKYLSEEKNKQQFFLDEELKYRCGQRLFNYEYNVNREFVMPQEYIENKMNTKSTEIGVKDFLTSPMTDHEKKHFGAEFEVPADMKDEYWVPEDTKTALPEDNPMGYGVDMLRTFMKPTNNEEEKDIKPIYDVPVVENVAEQEGWLTEPPKEFADTKKATLEDDEIRYNKWRKTSWISPIISGILVVSFVLFFPFKSNTVDEFAQQFTISYGENIAFNDKQELIEKVLINLAGSRNIESIDVSRLSEKNFKIIFVLKDSELKSEEFVFFKSEDGRWGARKYQAIVE